MKLDDLLNKPHVQRSKVLKGFALEQQANSNRIAKGEELRDMFSERPSLASKDRKFSSVVLEAVQETRRVLSSLNFPMLPQIAYVKSRNVRFASHDETQVVSGVIDLNCRITSKSGVDVEATIPVNVRKGEVIPPTVMQFNGSDYVISQSSVDKIINRHSSFELMPLRDQYQPFQTRGEMLDTLSVRNAIGWQPRMPRYPNEKSSPVIDRIPRRVGRILHQPPIGWAAVVDVLEKAEDDGLDVFPRAWEHLYDTYIRPAVGEANKNDWEPFLVHEGFMINPLARCMRTQKTSNKEE